jgi:hypothetical protein
MTAQQTPPPPKQAISGFGLTLTVLGALCGALLTGVLEILQQREILQESDAWKLVSLTIGAALPPVVAALQQGGRRIRVVAAILLSVAALILAYFGLFAFTIVADKSPILPTPNQIAEWVDKVPPTPGDDGTKGSYAEGALKMTWTPRSVRCGDDGDCSEVTVTSEGAEQLRITGLEIQGDGNEYLKPTGCVGGPLNQNDHCTITLEFEYKSAPRSSTPVLVINQNFAGPATKIPIDAHGKGGPHPVDCTVPNVVRGTLADAEAKIKDARLVVGSERTEASSSVARGRVVRSIPAGGAPVDCHSTVTLVVSSGPERGG